MDISAGVYDKSCLIDVLGQIVEVKPLGDISFNGKTLSKLDVEFRDALSSKLSCTLWGDYAKLFWEESIKYAASKTVCLLRFVVAKLYRGEWTITNSFDATQFLFNPTIPEVARFNTLLPADDLTLTIVENSHTNLTPRVPLYEEFFLLNKKKTIYDIVNSAEEYQCVTVGIIDSIDESSWYYIICLGCKQTVQPYPANGDVPIFDCVKCGRISGLSGDSDLGDR
ncbi:unnamed protein product [Arabis nemorensis]|uniref:Replication factor A C-terminal domain-containing protein n=1 Tax=Arabis nemorensis TaxID=586526 RepID=A0A565B936_9BRAS|nr:unnamed protein product [Arabis nemorensis]